MQPTSLLLSLSPEDLRILVSEAVAQALEQSLPMSIEQKTDAVAGQDGFLTREQTAQELHVSLPTLRNYERRGSLKPQRIGRRVLYRRSDVLAVGRVR